MAYHNVLRNINGVIFVKYSRALEFLSRIICICSNQKYTLFYMWVFVGDNDEDFSREHVVVVGHISQFKMLQMVMFNRLVVT